MNGTYRGLAMAYDRELAEHVRELVSDRPDVTERRMFGGPAWLVNGTMAIVARGQGGLMLRLDPADHEPPDAAWRDAARGDAQPRSAFGGGS